MAGSRFHLWLLILVTIIPGGLLLSVNSLHKEEQKMPDRWPQLLEQYQAEVRKVNQCTREIRQCTHDLHENKNEQKFLHQILQQCQEDFRQYIQDQDGKHSSKSLPNGYHYAMKKENDDEESSLGFTIELSDDRSLSDQVPITFDRVILDSTNAFTPLLGSFTCPNNSHFAFYWSVQAPQGRVEASLVKHGEEQKYGALTCEMPESFSGTSSMSTIAQCTEGQQIWVKAIGWPDDDACNKAEAVYTSFTGFRLFGEDEDLEEQVGFTAELSANTSNNPSIPIFYDTVHVNLGNSYNPENGEFDSPSAGVYIFTVSGHIVRGSNTIMLLRKNGAEICRPALVRYSGSDWSNQDSGTSTGTCTMELDEGDVITVTSTSDSKTHLAQASSFTGYRLPDSEEGDPVAFTVRLTSDRNEYHDDANMIFEDIITNVGNRYFPTMGFFICPDSEFYFLTWSVAAGENPNGRAAEAKLMTGATEQTEEVKRGPRTSESSWSGGGMTSSSTQAIVQCEPERAFFIRAVVSDSVNMQYRPDVTTFSGFRLPKS